MLALLLATLLSSAPASHARAGLAAPSNLSPDATSVTGIPVLSWSKVSGATNYAVEVYRVSDSTKICPSTTTVQRHVVPARHSPGSADVAGARHERRHLQQARLGRGQHRP